MAVVVFNYLRWIEIYPMFNTVGEPQAQSAFDTATLFLNNTDLSPVCDVDQRAKLLDLLTAHIAALTYGVNGEAPSGLVGRVSSAGEGSVNVSTEYGGANQPGREWYVQTQWGALYWQATAQYRMFHYIPHQRPILRPSSVLGRGNYGYYTAGRSPWPWLS